MISALNPLCLKMADVRLDELDLQAHPYFPYKYLSPLLLSSLFSLLRDIITPSSWGERGREGGREGRREGGRMRMRMRRGRAWVVVYILMSGMCSLLFFSVTLTYYLSFLQTLVLLYVCSCSS